jgi:outer membrane protein OmpA-like peptidoglycan-associated protein
VVFAAILPVDSHSFAKVLGEHPTAMAMEDGRVRGFLSPLGAAVVILAVGVAGCSWFGGSADKDLPSKSTLAADRDKPPPGADQSFPNLASVPEKPTPTSAAERQKMAEGLVADRENARYSSEVIRRQGEVGMSPALPPAVPPAAAIAQLQGGTGMPPPPPAVPAAPVAKAPVPVPAAKTTQPAAAPTASAGVPRLQPPKAPEGETARPSLRAPVAIPFHPEDSGPVVVTSDGVTGGYGMLGASGVPKLTLVSGDGGQALVAEGGIPFGGGFGGTKVATIQFANGSAALTSTDRRILAQVRDLQRQRGGMLRVVGHASSRTRDMDMTRHDRVNQDVSARRAEAVAVELRRLGVAAEAVQIAARADRAPLYREVMPSGEAGNRRTEIYLD